MRRLLLVFSCALFIHACNPPDDNISGKIDAYVPIYGTTEAISNIAVEPQKPTVEAGKIYAYGNYIFQNDLNTGIHIIDNSNKNNPVKIAFLKLPFSTEIAVKGNFLYSNIMLTLLYSISQSPPILNW